MLDTQPSPLSTSASRSNSAGHRSLNSSEISLLRHDAVDSNDEASTPLLRLNDIGFTIHEHVSKSAKKSAGWLAGAKSARRLQHNTLVTADTTVTRTIAANHIPGRKQLLSHINMTILPYEKVSIIGPNGAGKSTLMKLILGLIAPSSGNIIRNDKLSISYVPQKFSVPPILPLRVEDLLAQVMRRLSLAQQQLLYERLSIAPLLKQQVIHLSGGETQRVLLARALLSKPNLLILDEPMQGLDPESERWLYEFIDNLPDFLRCAMVVVSHDLHWVMQGSRRVICLNKHICCEGQPSDLGVSAEFKALFGHQYEQPYIHQSHDCGYSGRT